MELSIHHIALRTHDLAGLELFYAAILGMRPARRSEAQGSVWLNAGGTVLMLERAAPDECIARAGTRDLVAFAVDNIGPWRARFGGAGVAIEAETAHTLYVRDPDGRRVGVSDYPF